MSTRSRRIRATHAALGAALLGLTVGAAAGAEVTESPMHVGGRIRHVTAADLDGDSLADLVVLSITGHAADAAHHLSVFWQRPGQSFPEKPDIVWDVDREIVALDLSANGSAVGQPTPVYSLRADGVRRHRFNRQGGGVESTSVLVDALDHLVPANEWVAVIDFVADWRNRGDEALVPAFPYPKIIPLNAERAGESVRLETEPIATYWITGSEKELRGASVNLRYAFPVPVAADQNADGLREIAFIERNRVIILDASAPPDDTGFLQKRVYPVRILTDEEAASDSFTVHGRLLDLNGDARADLLAVVYRETGIFQLEGRVLVFYCRRNGSFMPDPDEEVQVKNALYSLTHVLDLDGNGRPEIILPSAKLGLWGYLRVLTTRKVSFDFNTVAHRGESGFDTAAATHDGMTARLSKNYDLPVIKLEDINGDGLVDVLIGSGESRICIHAGLKDGERRFRSKPTSCFEANPYAVYTIVDLNVDDKRELVRYDPRSADPGRLVLTVLGD